MCRGWVHAWGDLLIMSRIVHLWHRILHGLIRIHYLVDIVFGLLVSELAYRLVLERLEKGRALATIPAARAAACTMGIVVAGFAGYAVVLGI